MGNDGSTPEPVPAPETDTKQYYDKTYIDTNYYTKADTDTKYTPVATTTSVSTDVSNLATDIPKTYYNKKDSDARFAPMSITTTLDGKYVPVSNLVNYYTKTDSDTRYAPASVATTLDGKYIPIGDAGKFATVTTVADLSTSIDKNLTDNYYNKTQTEARYAPASMIGSFYDKSESDSRFAPSTIKDTYYDKTESDAKFAPVDASYKKVEADTRFSPIGVSYTKAETEDMYSLKAAPGNNNNASYLQTTYAPLTGLNNLTSLLSTAQGDIANMKADITSLQTDVSTLKSTSVSSSGLDTILSSKNYASQAYVNTILGNYTSSLRPYMSWTNYIAYIVAGGFNNVLTAANGGLGNIMYPQASSSSMVAGNSTGPVAPSASTDFALCGDASWTNGIKVKNTGLYDIYVNLIMSTGYNSGEGAATMVSLLSPNQDAAAFAQGAFVVTVVKNGISSANIVSQGSYNPNNNSVIIKNLPLNANDCITPLFRSYRPTIKSVGGIDSVYASTTESITIVRTA